MKDYKSLDDFIKILNLSDKIITNDFDAWVKFKSYRHIYDKLFIAYSQNIECGPMGIYPKKYPIIIKPIINLFGMSRGFKIINCEIDYNNNIKDGFFWMEYFPEEQLNLDLIIINGEIKFYAALLSKDNQDGTFDYHESLPNYKINSKLEEWVRINLKNYIGCLNLEIINDNIIEAHLRLNGDFYLYDINFIKELEKLYLDEKWDINYQIKKIYLFPIFVNSSLNVKNIDFNNVLKLMDYFKANSLRIDNLNSNHQKKNKARLFMFDINNMEHGNKLRDLIKKLV